MKNETEKQEDIKMYILIRDDIPDSEIPGYVAMAAVDAALNPIINMEPPELVISDTLYNWYQNLIIIICSVTEEEIFMAQTASSPDEYTVVCYQNENHKKEGDAAIGFYPKKTYPPLFDGFKRIG